MSISRRFALQVLATAAVASTAFASPGWAIEPMRIGVVGAGSLGGTVAEAWVKAGHEVMFSSRHPDELLAKTRPLGPRASVGTPQQAAAFGTVVFFATPYDALPQLGKDLGDALRGKVVLDATNPSWYSLGAIDREAKSNGVGTTSAKYLPGTRLVRAFNSTDAWAIEASSAGRGDKLGVPLASDDAEAMKVAAQLVRDAGCEPVVVGDLAAGKAFENGGAGFRANTSAPKLRQLLGLPTGSDAL